MSSPGSTAGAAAKAGTAHRVAGAAKAGAATAAKFGLGSKAVAAGGLVASFAGRRALWPAMVVGSAFGGALWFGAFEIFFSASKLAFPVPAIQDDSAKYGGAATVPVTAGGVCWVGSKLAPLTAPPPASVVDLSGTIGWARSLPVKHYAATIGASAAISAICCRAFQYRGGA